MDKDLERKCVIRFNDEAVITLFYYPAKTEPFPMDAEMEIWFENSVTGFKYVKNLTIKQ